MGHKLAHGNTAENYRTQVLGARARGRPRDGPFNHSTGRGWVKQHVGTYDDPIRQGCRVTVALVEVSGALEASLLKYAALLTRRTRGAHARDGTRYGASKMSTKSFYAHHTQRISRAAACGDVEGLLENVRGRAQHMAARTSAAAAGQP